jgi:hypothetical protein
MTRPEPSWLRYCTPHYRRSHRDYPPLPCDSCRRRIGAQRSHQLVLDPNRVTVLCAGCYLLRRSDPRHHLAAATRAGAHWFLGQFDAAEHGPDPDS